LSAAEILQLMAERHGGIPEAVLNDPDLVNLMGGALKADLTIMEAYRSDVEEPLECPVIALGGDQDEWVSPEELDAWAKHTRGDFSAQIFRGGHFYFRSAEVLPSLLAKIRQSCLGLDPLEGPS
jgi:surfactin synthase thioesterase subunit